MFNNILSTYFDLQDVCVFVYVCEECNRHYSKYELTLDFQIKISILFSSPCPVANGRIKFLLPYNGYIKHTHIYHFSMQTFIPTNSIL